MLLHIFLLQLQKKSVYFISHGTSMRIVTYLDEQNNDCVSKLIQECIDEQYVHWSLDEFVKSVTNKIEAAVKVFLERSMNPDGYLITHLQWPIFEIRISLPRTKQLMRIFFACESQSLILLTWWLIKPKSYTQKKQLQTIQKRYSETLQDALRIYEDWKWQNSYFYKDIFTHLH